jgi:mono/diheme cytochrome c family protein
MERREMAGNVLFAGAVIALFAVTKASAQDVGDVERGRAYVERACADCHAVRRNQAESPNPNAFSFEAIARFPGLAAPSLFELLRTSHKTMPNIVIETNDLRDVVAYILNLK